MWFLEVGKPRSPGLGTGSNSADEPVQPQTQMGSSLDPTAPPLTVHVVSSQPMMAQRGRMSELSTSFEGWTTPQM